MYSEQSMSVKAYLDLGGGKNEVRRFGLPEVMATNFICMKEKVCGIFGLSGQPIILSWKDNENDDIVVSSDEELMEAITDTVSRASTTLFRIYVTVGVRPDLGHNNSLPGSESGALHEGIVCDECEGLISGFRYKCMHCKDFDLCAACEHKGKHHEHRVMRIPTPKAKSGPKFWSHEHGRPAGHFSTNFGVNTDNGGNIFSQSASDSASGGLFPKVGPIILMLTIIFILGNLYSYLFMCWEEGPRFHARHGCGRGRYGSGWGGWIGRPWGGALLGGFGCPPGPNIPGTLGSSQNQQQQQKCKKEGFPFMEAQDAAKFGEEAARVAAQSAEEASKMAEEVAAQASQFASHVASQMSSEHVVNLMREMWATAGAVQQGDTAASNSNTDTNWTQSENNSVHHTVNCGHRRCYNFRRIQTNTIRFRVQARNDVSLCLSPDNQEQPEDMYEVFIGAWRGTQSAIRRKKVKDVCKVKTPNIVSADEMRGFWIKIAHGVIKVGREGELQPFMSHTDPEILLHVTHYGFCTAYGSDGDWIFFDDKEDDASDLEAEDLEAHEEKGTDSAIHQEFRPEDFLRPIQDPTNTGVWSDAVGGVAMNGEVGHNAGEFMGKSDNIKGYNLNPRLVPSAPKLFAKDIAKGQATGAYKNGVKIEVKDIFKKLLTSKQQTPFIHKLDSGLRPGSFISFLGQINPEPYRFAINFKTTERSDANIVLHINPRFDWNLTVLNTRENGYWGPESRPSLSSLVPGKQFKIGVTCNAGGFMISLNDKLWCNYGHRISPDKINYVEVVGDVNDVSITI